MRYPPHRKYSGYFSTLQTGLGIWYLDYAWQIMKISDHRSGSIHWKYTSTNICFGTIRQFMTAVSLFLSHLRVTESWATVISFGCRMTHSGGGVPEDLLNQMFGTNGEASDEGISLLISRKLVKLMNGDVQYLREAGRSTFIISVELAVANQPAA